MGRQRVSESEYLNRLEDDEADRLVRTKQRRALLDEFIVGGFTVIGLALIVVILAAAR